MRDRVAGKRDELMVLREEVRAVATDVGIDEPAGLFAASSDWMLRRPTRSR